MCTVVAFRSLGWDGCLICFLYLRVVCVYLVSLRRDWGTVYGDCVYGAALSFSAHTRWSVLLYECVSASGLVSE